MSCLFTHKISGTNVNSQKEKKGKTANINNQRWHEAKKCFSTFFLFLHSHRMRRPSFSVQHQSMMIFFFFGFQFLFDQSFSIVIISFYRQTYHSKDINREKNKANWLDNGFSSLEMWNTKHVFVCYSFWEK